MQTNHLNPVLRFYGRRKARPLKDAQKALISTISKWAFEPHQLTIEQTNILEIGFGGGENLAHMAKNNPQMHYYGAEVFQNGIASLLTHIDKNHLLNVGIYPNDVRHLLKEFPENSLDKIYLLFPDPWPKARHDKRRFIQPETIEDLARIIKPEGLWHIASDHPIYQEWVDVQMSQQSYFQPVHKDLRDRANLDHGSVIHAPMNRPLTRYEQKALRENRTPYFWTFQRVA